MAINMKLLGKVEVGYEPDQDWPQEGKIQFLDYNTQYRPGLELVLKGTEVLK